MKNSFTFYVKLLGLYFFLLLLSGNTLSAQEPAWCEPINSPFGLSGSSPGGGGFVDIVDIDHDGTLEAFVSSTDAVHYFENIGSNTQPDFVLEANDTFGINYSERRPWQFVDITGDGLEDLFLFGFLNNSPVQMVKNMGDSTTPNFPPPVMNNPFGIYLPASDYDQSLLDAVAPTFADIDNDGDFDLFLGGVFLNNPEHADEALYFFRNNDPSGDGTDPQFGTIEKNPFGFVFPPNTHLHWEIFEDLDCDGDLDMYLAGPETNFYYYENFGNPTEPDFSGGGVYSGYVAYPFNPPAGSFLDIGGDGDMDLINSTQSEGIWFFENSKINSCTVLSTKDLALDATISLYPNPASDFLNFELVSAENLDEVIIEIFNMNGQKLNTRYAALQNQTLQQTISVKSLPAGIYLLKVSSKDKFLVQKFLKQYAKR